MAKKTIPTPRPKRKRVPKPVLAMAAPAPEHPVVSIEKLKGGELNWSIRVPATSLPRAIDRAVAEAKRLAALLDTWKQEEASKKEAELAARMVASAEGGGK